MALHEIALALSQFFFVFFTRTHFFSDVFSTVNRSISPDQQIVVYAPTYLGNMSIIVDEYLRNDSEHRLVLENYMVMQLVALMRPTLSQVYRDAGKAFQKAMLGERNIFKTLTTLIIQMQMFQAKRHITSAGVTASPTPTASWASPSPRSSSRTRSRASPSPWPG